MGQLSFPLVSNQTHQNYGQVTVGNKVSFLLLQIKRRVQDGQETHCCNRTWLTVMWKQLHSLTYSLPRKMGICFQKGKGLQDVSWFFVIWSVLSSMIYHGVLESSGLRASSSRACPTTSWSLKLLFADNLWEAFTYGKTMWWSSCQLSPLILSVCLVALTARQAMATAHGELQVLPSQR